jgi:hypothetical protein
MTELEMKSLTLESWDDDDDDDGDFVAEAPEDDNKSASQKLWDSWHGLFDFFNDELFSSSLDANRVILNCSRTQGRSTLGFYMGLLSENKGAWIEDGGQDQKAEISMNPTKMAGRPLDEILATFVHELCHFWQDLHGSPGKRGYHNKEWADKMLEVGLQPVNNNDPTKVTGMSMHHSIIPGGRFAKTMEQLPEHLKLPFLGLNTVRPKGKTGYQKWRCPRCLQICRAKDTADIACMPCSIAAHIDGEEDFFVSMVAIGH